MPKLGFSLGCSGSSPLETAKESACEGRGPLALATTWCPARSLSSQAPRLRFGRRWRCSSSSLPSNEGDSLCLCFLLELPASSPESLSARRLRRSVRASLPGERERESRALRSCPPSRSRELRLLALGLCDRLRRRSQSWPRSPALSRLEYFSDESRSRRLRLLMRPASLDPSHSSSYREF